MSIYLTFLVVEKNECLRYELLFYATWRVLCSKVLLMSSKSRACAAYREVRREALTWVNIGKPLVRQESWRGSAGDSPVKKM